MSGPPVDLEALLAALVLAPATFSRNRFFSLYTDASARRVRRRAALLRSVVRHVVSGDAERVAASPETSGGLRLGYEVPALGLKRTVALEGIEVSLVRFAIAHEKRSAPAAAPGDDAAAAPPNGLPAALSPEPADSARVDRVLARLLPAGCGEDGNDAIEAGDQGELGSATRPRPPRGRAQRDTQAP